MASMFSRDAQETVRCGFEVSSGDTGFAYWKTRTSIHRKNGIQTMLLFK